MSALAARHERPLGRLRIVAYAAPQLPVAIVLFPAYAILPTFYASHTRIPLALIGTILIASRLFDAILDPVIGWLSDITRTRWGRRKPWMMAGGLLTCVAVWALYVPAAGVGPVYYGAWLMAFYIGFTFIEIPHKAWGTEIARRHAQRAEVSTWLGIWFGLGNLAFAVVPLAPMFAGHGYDAASLRAIALLVIALLPLTLGAAVWIAPQGQPTTAPATGPWRLLRSAVANALFLRLLAIMLLTGFGQGIFYGSVFLFVRSVLNLGPSFAWLLLADALVTLAATPLWLQAVRRLGKPRAWAIGAAASAGAILAMAWARPGDLPMILFLVSLRAAAGAVVYVAPHALLGDVIDYDMLRSGANRAGAYHALMALVTKANGAVAGGLALVLIGAVGFSAAHANPPAAVAGFKLVVLAPSAAILVLAGVSAWGFPLDSRRHEIVRRRIAALAARAA